MPTMNFRATDEQKTAIEAKAKEYGFESVAGYIKFVCLNSTISVSVPTKAETEVKDLLSIAKKDYTKYATELYEKGDDKKAYAVFSKSLNVAIGAINGNPEYKEDEDYIKSDTEKATALIYKNIKERIPFTRTKVRTKDMLSSNINQVHSAIDILKGVI